MKINISQVLTTVEGKNFKEGGEGSDDLTLSTVLGTVLTIEKSKDVWKQYLLANKIAKAKTDEVDLKTDEIVFIKEVLQQNAKGERTAYFPYILGQCIDLLEGVEDEKK